MKDYILRDFMVYEELRKYICQQTSNSHKCMNFEYCDECIGNFIQKNYFSVVLKEDKK